MQTVPAMSRARARARTDAFDNRGALRHFDLTEGYLSLSLVKCTGRRLHACACVSTHAATATLQRRTQHFTNSELAISPDTRVSLRERTWEGWMRPRQCPGFAHLPAISAATKPSTVLTRRATLILSQFKDFLFYYNYLYSFYFPLKKIMRKDIARYLFKFYLYLCAGNLYYEKNC